MLWPVFLISSYGISSQVLSYGKTSQKARIGDGLDLFVQ